MSGKGKGSKIPSPEELDFLVDVAEKAIPVVNQAGNVVIDLVDKAAPVLENVGNHVFNIVDRGLETADNAIDKIIDIPFKFARKAQNLNNGGGGVKNGLKDAIGLIRDVEIKSSLIQRNVI